MPGKALIFKAFVKLPEKIAEQQIYENQQLTRFEIFFRQNPTADAKLNAMLKFCV